MNSYTKSLLVTVLNFQILATPLTAQERLLDEDMNAVLSQGPFKGDSQGSLEVKTREIETQIQKIDMFETANFRFETLHQIRGHQLDLISEFCSAYLTLGGQGSSVFGRKCDPTSLYKVFLSRMADSSEISRTFFVYNRSNQQLKGVLKGEKLDNHVLYSGTLMAGESHMSEVYKGLYKYAQEKAQSLQDPTTLRDRYESKFSSPVQIQGAGWIEGVLSYLPEFDLTNFPIKKRDGERLFVFADFNTPAAAKISTPIRFLSESEKTEILAREPDTKIVTIYTAESLHDFPRVTLLKPHQTSQDMAADEHTSYFTLKNTIIGVAGTTLAVLAKKAWNRLFRKPPVSPREAARREAARRFRPSHPENRGDDGFSPRLPTSSVAFFPGHGGSASPSVVLPVNPGLSAASSSGVGLRRSAEDLRDAQILEGLILPELQYVNHIPARVGAIIERRLQDVGAISLLAREIRSILQNSDVQATQGVKAWDDARRRLEKALRELQSFNEKS